MWTQDPEHGERSCMTEYRHPLGFEEGTRRNRLVSSCIHGHTLAWNLQMMMMVTLMIIIIMYANLYSAITLQKNYKGALHKNCHRL